MNRRNGIIVAIILILVLLGGWYFIQRGTSLPYTIIETGDRQHREETAFYTIQINYPDETPLEERGSRSAEARAQDAIEDLLEAQVASFKTTVEESLTDEERARLEQNQLKYSLNTGYHAYSSGGYISYEFSIFMDTGGAHPNNYFETLVFDLDGRTVELGDLFQAGTPYLERVAEEAERQVAEQLLQRAGSQATSSLVAEGVAPQAENFKHFVVDSDRLRIFIPPYQAAPYAAGSFEVQIPLVDIRDILKPDVR